MTDADRERIAVLRDVSIHFEHRGLFATVRGRREAPVRAVDGVDLAIARESVVGLVGESGSGKTTLGRTLLGLVPSTAGEVLYDGHDLSKASRSDLRTLRRRVQMIFQDAHGSLSPRLRVSQLLTEPFKIHRVPQAQRRDVGELLNLVDLSEDVASKYPHELSGGQAKRVAIARALALAPEFIVADEPTAGLDVSTAASILNLMLRLAHELSLTYLVITHDLGVVGYIADQVGVMYLGKLVEFGPTEDILRSPHHPYTRALLAASAVQRGAAVRLLLPGEIPSPKNPPQGCRFHTRCAYVQSRCRSEVPRVEDVGACRSVACHFWRQLPEIERTHLGTETCEPVRARADD